MMQAGGLGCGRSSGLVVCRPSWVKAGSWVMVTF